MFTLQNFKNKHMNKIKKTLILILAIVLSASSIKAQTDNKDVAITSSGSGKTLEDAKQAALRSATEQAFGAFISSKTEMFNDQIVADQMASVSSGNIKSFEILNQDQLPDSRWGVTLKAIVSVDKLTSFVQAKGIAIEVKGGMFALNIKQQSLNEQGEINAVSEMVGLLHEAMQISFDYVIKSSDPKSLDAENKNWEIPLVVTATCNKNIDFCANYFMKTLAAISLSPTEVETYKSLNKQVFLVSVTYQNKSVTYNLRKQSSIAAIHSLTSNWQFFTRLFAVQSGMDELYGNWEGNIYSFSGDRSYYNDDNAGTRFIHFPTSGNVAATFIWSDKRTLAQIEQMTGYTIKSRGVVSQFKYGGFLVYEENGHGLVAAITDLGKMEWYPGKQACENLVSNGFSDWHLPTKSELNKLFLNLHTKKIGDFLNKGEYWSSTYSDYYPWYQIFDSGITQDDKLGSSYEANIRAVRTF